MTSPKRSTSPLSPGRAKAGKTDTVGKTTSLRGMLEMMQSVDVHGAQLVIESKDTLVKSLSSSFIGRSGAASLSRWAIGNSLADGKPDLEVKEKDSSPSKGTLKLPPPTSIAGQPSLKADAPGEGALTTVPSKATNAEPDDWSSSYIAKSSKGFMEIGKGLRNSARRTLGRSSSTPSLRALPSGQKLAPLRRADDATGGGASPGGATPPVGERSLGATRGCPGSASMPEIQKTAMEEDLGIRPPATPMRFTPLKQQPKKLKRIEKRAGSTPALTGSHSLRGMKSEIDSKLTATSKDKPVESYAQEAAMSFVEQWPEDTEEADETSDFEEDDLSFFHADLPAPTCIEEALASDEPLLDTVAAADCADACLFSVFDGYSDDLPFFELSIPQRPHRGRSISPSPAKFVPTYGEKRLAITPRNNGRGFRCANWEWPVAKDDSQACQQAFTGGLHVLREPVVATVA